MILQSGILISQNRGLKSISEQELKYHLEFIAAPEFRGRQTPSSELEIATLYLGHWAKNNGLRPILNDGSFYQEIPYEVSSISAKGTRIRISEGNGEKFYYFGKTFGGNFSTNGAYTGKIVFAGFGLNLPDYGWDDFKDIDVTGKIVLILDDKLPEKISPAIPASASRLNSRVAIIQKLGASAVFSIINPVREDKLSRGLRVFEYTPGGNMINTYDSQRTNFESSPATKTTQTVVSSRSFIHVEIGHDVASDIMGVSKKEIGEMFQMIKEGKKIGAMSIDDIRVQVDVEMESYKASSRNVIAMVEGSDPKLKDEYIVIGAHHDHIGIRNGDVIAGADDDGTGTIALMGIARALVTERPKRSVILAWFTGEERGLHGSNYFVNNSPVPVEKISACINLDMLGRNPTDSLFLVASNLLSSELDAGIQKVNKLYKLNFGFDYRYSNLNHPQRVYFRSDQYPFIRFGIPSVWIFCGFTPDYHTPKDILEFIDYKKLCRSTMLVYLTAFEIGNMKELLKLDINPAVSSRGKHNVREKSLFQNVTQ